MISPLIIAGAVFGAVVGAGVEATVAVGAVPLGAGEALETLPPETPPIASRDICPISAQAW
ncbi:MAG: hypothetical protein GJ676_11730 [Rhodobacteraceae bacterium]|nr:hypothetical protein [Paracoccaceae bacterium]